MARIQLIYDRSCPACEHYTRLLHIREDIGALELINAREHPEWVATLRQQGIDLNNDMLLKLDDQEYRGAEALHMLALLGSDSGLFNRLNHWLFRSTFRSKLCYPVMRLGRKLLLLILRRKGIE
ncbi:DCC1-like thiol-disulfide oxidoreductase family protein [Aliamphritea hakodatensis]|uniref:DCC1-like thiol-disulfide oxidoreductase family protein n=1 Tax=Aliamphritea hakodatensis TaxID=2895352 RepID=UPI0022FD634E|nr:DCC1-like thiol-disulfide oxidoreductase family protein [Aliamphritea hakodatensis]